MLEANRNHESPNDYYDSRGEAVVNWKQTSLKGMP
jgi:hypothetical protein